MLNVTHTNTPTPPEVFLLQIFTMKLRSQSELHISKEKLSRERGDMCRVPQKFVNTDISYIVFLNMIFLIHIFQNKNSSKN